MNTNVCIIPASGRLSDGEDADALRMMILHSCIKTAIDSGQTNIVLDVSSLTFINSTGLGTMVAWSVSCRNAGGRLVLAAPDERMQRLLETTKLNLVFESYPTLAQAVASF